MSPLLHDGLLILASVLTWIVIQRLAQRALFDYARRLMVRLVERVRARAAGRFPPPRLSIFDRMFTASEEDALDRLVNGDLEEVTSAQVYSDWLVVREAYDRKTGRRL